MKHTESKADNEFVSGEEPEESNPLLAELKKKAQGGLKKRSQADIDADMKRREEELRKKLDQETAETGKRLFNTAMLDQVSLQQQLQKKFSKVNVPDEDEEEPIDSDEWEF